MPLKKLSAQLEGVELSYFDSSIDEDAGTNDDRKTILLIHGFASNASVNWISTGWLRRLVDDGYRVVALDNRGHGASQKFYSPEDYGPDIFAADAIKLLDHLNIQNCDIMGYSMGARIACWLCHQFPERVNRAVFGGMGAHIYGGRGGYEEIAQALETDEPELIEDKWGRVFRKFADATGSDRLALAACIRPSKYRITPEIVSSIYTPILVAVGSEDDVGGSAEELANAMPNATAFVMEGLDHMKATGAEPYKQRALEFLAGESA